MTQSPTVAQTIEALWNMFAAQRQAGGGLFNLLVSSLERFLQPQYKCSLPARLNFLIGESKICRGGELCSSILLHRDGGFHAIILVATLRPAFAIEADTDPLLASADNVLPLVLILRKGSWCALCISHPCAMCVWEFLLLAKLGQLLHWCCC